MSNIHERVLVKDTILSVGLVVTAMAWLAIAAGTGALQAREPAAAPEQVNHMAAGACNPLTQKQS